MKAAVCSLALAIGWAQAVYAAAPEVTIDPGGVSPQALQAIVASVNVITRLAEDQDGGELSRLRRRACEATLSALETQGYFSPTVVLNVGEDPLGETWDIVIKSGERTRVDKVALDFSGGITAPGFHARTDLLKQSWPLTQGMPFINEEWNRAKGALIDDVRSKDFYLARVTTSQATIHADKAQADLHVAIDSGPRVRLGKVEVIGLKRVPRELIDHYVRYAPGQPYRQDQLDDWQQALQSTSFFRGAFVSLDSTPAHRVVMPDGDVEMPLQVRVSEAPARRFSASLGVDSDNGVRGEALYRQNVVFGKPVWIETGAGADKNRQRAFFDVHFAPDLAGNKDSVGLLLDHFDIEGVDTRRAGVGWNRIQERKAQAGSRVEYETKWGLVGAYDKTRVEGAETYEVPSLVGTWQWLRRDVDDTYNPREGNLIELGLGAGVTLDRGEGFYKSGLRARQWWPIGKRDVLTLRGEVGKVWSRTSRLPEDFGYRTGGARTIRGYRFESIGVSRGSAIIGAPALAVASIEYMHYFTQQFGMSVFVDAGDAAESFGAMKMAVGYGIGALARTPAGPLEVDLAWAQRDHKLRIHFSMGIAF